MSRIDWTFQKHLELRKHDGEYALFGELANTPPTREGIRVSYSDITDNFYINNLSGEPTDSYGVNWIMCQSVVTLHEDEIDQLITILQEAKAARKKMNTLMSSELQLRSELEVKKPWYKRMFGK